MRGVELCSAGFEDIGQGVFQGSKGGEVSTAARDDGLVLEVGLEDLDQVASGFGLVELHQRQGAGNWLSVLLPGGVSDCAV